MHALILFSSLWRSRRTPEGASLDTVAPRNRLSESAVRTSIAAPRPAPWAMPRPRIGRGRALRNDGVLGLRWLR